jgi:hypothetical protein
MLSGNLGSANVFVFIVSGTILKQIKIDQIPAVVTANLLWKWHETTFRNICLYCKKQDKSFYNIPSLCLTGMGVRLSLLNCKGINDYQECFRLVF